MEERRVVGEEDMVKGLLGGGVNVLGGMVGHADVEGSETEDAQLILCVITRKNTIYNEIKRISETVLGVLTQCMMHRFVLHPSVPYANSLVFKLNAKLGGVNCHVVERTEGKAVLPVFEDTDHVTTMVLGADVTHPPPGKGEMKSLAAVVGSLDDKYCEYRATTRAQTACKEIITEMEDMVLELLSLYFERNHVYPHRIIMFRDGVSEGQFGEVALEEVSAVRRASRRVGSKGRVTFLVVNKRHHVRVFPREGEGDSKGNCLAGTVVDSDVTHPFEYDFYLTSHSGLQGTSKPAHYHVLYDENGFGPDDLQEVTYRLCYLFARSTRSVSIPPPAYYAHLVASRARCHVQGDANGQRKIDSLGMRGKLGGRAGLPSVQSPRKEGHAVSSIRNGIGGVKTVAVKENIRRMMYFT
ncbi:Eukaryotic translation initiation factor 2C [Rhizophlyctis rosea]|uniref:Eukaryotic translation initiation factor 2C n=1 Tax=Rhizophlyctis rosea TaxID=64517 RepID=A0AAD5X1M2_9FUNG|nr:Eukaryotic translation initiation factor 2C [Rhizophlyctis rosea]